MANAGAPTLANAFRRRGKARLRVGVHTWELSSRVDQDYAAIAQAFEQALGAIGQPSAVDIEPFAVYGELTEALLAGRIDVARLESATYLEVRERGQLPLLALEQPAMATPRRAVVVTAADSAIASLADARGHSFAFGDQRTAVGRYLPQAALREAGVEAEALSRSRYMRRPDKIAAAVRLGEYDLGVLSYALYRREARAGTLRVVATIDDAPQPWVARRGLEPSLLRGLADALQAMDASRSLRSLGIVGFTAPDASVYEPVRAAKRAAAAFGPGTAR